VETIRATLRVHTITPRLLYVLHTPSYGLVRLHGTRFYIFLSLRIIDRRNNRNSNRTLISRAPGLINNL